MVRTVKTMGKNSCLERCSKTVSHLEDHLNCAMQIITGDRSYSQRLATAATGVKNRSAFYQHYQRYEGGLNRLGAFFCPRVMACRFGTVSRWMIINISVYSCCWVGKGCTRAAYYGKSAPASHINACRTRSAAHTQKHLNLLNCSNKMEVAVSQQAGGVINS